MQALEIACDESGYEGEKLIDTTTDVFAHAGVRLGTDVAAACLAELRRRIRSPATEYKATHLLREKHRAVLVWFLGPSSPLFRNAHVYLIDKVYFALGKLTDVMTSEPVAAGLAADGRSRAASDALYRDGTSHDFLTAANTMMRARDRADVTGPVDSFFRVAGALGGLDGDATGSRAQQRNGRAPGLTGGGDGPGNIPAMWQPFGRGGRTAGRAGAFSGREKAVAFRQRMRDDPTLSLLDPLTPAVMRAVARWGAGGRPVTIVHDRQTMLPQERVARLQRELRAAGLTLERVELAAAEFEARVQLADILAGTVRKIAQDELHGCGDGELTMLVRPYVDEQSIWGDDRSWASLRS
ncbi:hypothetical protein GCM10010435_78350 [Winogradskya consettensis]|uniref:DUF3800 domain-containing protein n=1 Tax=Winogradskya consettensis TaxID=113560 RepID=A0A919VQG2_9ACTN|nr:hypothetical protein [Actinoplanes consettensis]GIM74874.1 hypothetical protein Aco04nite_42560 [Actinoplanes consettensis]